MMKKVCRIALKMRGADSCLICAIRAIRHLIRAIRHANAIRYLIHTIRLPREKINYYQK